jgi:hypothetical protein
VTLNDPLFYSFFSTDKPQKSLLLQNRGTQKWGHEVVGVGGVIYDPEGNHESTYAWGLDITTNNQVEAYAIFRVSPSP